MVKGLTPEVQAIKATMIAMTAGGQPAPAAGGTGGNRKTHLPRGRSRKAASKKVDAEIRDAVKEAFSVCGCEWR